MEEFISLDVCLQRGLKANTSTHMSLETLKGRDLILMALLESLYPIWPHRGQKVFIWVDSQWEKRDII